MIKSNKSSTRQGRLLLAEDDWLEKHKHHFHPGHKQGGGKTGAGSSKGKAVAHPDGGAPDQVKLTSLGRQGGKAGVAIAASMVTGRRTANVLRRRRKR